MDRLVQQVRALADQSLERVKYVIGSLYGSLLLDSIAHEDGSSETTLKLTVTECGHRDGVLQTVAEGLGLKTSRTGFVKIPVQLGHVATEGAMGDRWLFFDATFGIYFAHPARLDEPLSLARARELYPNIVVMRVQVSEYTGEWLDVPAIEYAPVTIADVLAATGDPSAELFERTRITSEVFIRQRAQTYVSEVPLPVDRIREGSLGDRDGDSDDLHGNQIDLGYGESYLPHFEFVGDYRADGPQLAQRYQLMSSTEESFTLTLSFTEETPELIVDLDDTVRACGRDGTSVGQERTEKQVVLRAQVVPPLSRLTIQRRIHGRSRLDALSWTLVPNE